MKENPAGDSQAEANVFSGSLASFFLKILSNSVFETAGLFLYWAVRLFYEVNTWVNMSCNKADNFSDYIFPPWISQLFMRLNKPLWHASAGDKSLHPAPAGSVIKSRPSWSEIRLDCVLVFCDAASLMRFQVYMNKKRVTDVRRAEDMRVIFETSLWQFGESLWPRRRWPALPPHVLRFLTVRSSVFRLPAGWVQCVLHLTGAVSCCWAGCAFIDSILLHGFLLIAQLCLCMLTLASWVASILHWCLKECRYWMC